MIRLTEKMIASVLLFSLFLQLANAVFLPSPTLDDIRRLFLDTFLKDVEPTPCGLKRFDISNLTPEEIHDAFLIANFNDDLSLIPRHAAEKAETVAEAARCKLYHVPAQVFAQVYADFMSGVLETQHVLSTRNVASLAHKLARILVKTGCSSNELSPVTNIEILYQTLLTMIEDLNLVNKNSVILINDLFVNELNQLPNQC